jgi:hypothetical protein
MDNLLLEVNSGTSILFQVTLGGMGSRKAGRQVDGINITEGRGVTNYNMSSCTVIQFLNEPHIIVQSHIWLAMYIWI